MTRVLLIAVRPIHIFHIEAARERFAELGAEVHLLAPLDPDDVDLRSAGLHGYTRLKRLGRVPKDQPKQLAKKMWRRVSENATARELAMTADVLVALDPPAIFAVWQAARENRDAAACHGLAAGLRAAEQHAARTPRQQVKALARAVRQRDLGRGRRARKAWRSAAGEITHHPKPETLGKRHARLRREFDASVLRGKPDLTVQRAGFESHVEHADRLFERGDLNGAAAELIRAMWFAFHRSLHIDALDSPVARDPRGFLEPMLSSASYAHLVRRSERQLPVAPPPTDRPHRVLLATYANRYFLEPIIERYQNDPSVEVRYLDCSLDDTLRSLAMRAGTIDGLAARFGGDDALREEAEAELRPLIDWADTVLVDWCTNTAALINLVDPGDARIVVRLHSYEAFTRFPHVIDFSLVDDLVFVGPHLRDFCLEVAPALGAPGGPQLHVVANAMDLAHYRRPKADDDVRFNLALVGAKAAVKDPLWAVEILEELRRDDERYRLIIMGEVTDGRATPVLRDYEAALSERLGPLVADGAVELRGHVDDVPEALREVGVILSTSVRESFHCALVEGAASGAVPVVRDWPFFAERHSGPRALFPEEWVVSTPQEAARRIIAATQESAVWTQASRDTARLVVETWDWTRVAPAFDRILLGR